MGKLPAGVLQGNFLMYGDYEECLQVAPPASRDYQARYCVAIISVPQLVKYFNINLVN